MATASRPETLAQEDIPEPLLARQSRTPLTRRMWVYRVVHYNCAGERTLMSGSYPCEGRRLSGKERPRLAFCPKSFLPVRNIKVSTDQSGIRTVNASGQTCGIAWFALQVLSSGGKTSFSVE